MIPIYDASLKYQRSTSNSVQVVTNLITPSHMGECSQIIVCSLVKFLKVGRVVGKKQCRSNQRTAIPNYALVQMRA